MDLPMVHACVMLVHGEEGDNKFLVAYIVPEGTTSKKEVRSALKRTLPFYMIPSYFVFLERYERIMKILIAIVLNKNGGGSA